MTSTVADVRRWLERMPDDAEVFIVSSAGETPVATVAASGFINGKPSVIWLMTGARSPRSVVALAPGLVPYDV